MRSTYKIALIVFMVFAANVAISHVSDMTPIDSVITVANPVVMADGTVTMWAAPAVSHVALAVAVSVPVLTEYQGTPVTDTGGSARLHTYVTLEENDRFSNWAARNRLYNTIDTSITSYPIKRQLPVTDLEA